MVVTPDQLYLLLKEHFGDEHWWPVDHQYHKKEKSDPRFEVIIGAILTQNTAWTNVEKALDNLKQHHALTIKMIVTMKLDLLKTMIQPSGFFNQKALRLKNLSKYLHQKYGESLDSFFSRPTNEIREELLALNGIGPETADSILLYAGNHPVFVVDAYTRRLCKRLPLPTSISYDEIQHFFEQELQLDTRHKRVEVYKELHALIVEVAKQYCKKKPACTACPLTRLCQKML